MNHEKIKTVVIVGGSGDLGEGLVRSYIQAGYQVVVPSRSQTKIAQLKNYFSPEESAKIFGIIGNVSDEQEAKAIQNQIRADFGEISGAVAAIGSWWQGDFLLNLSKKDWQQVFNDSLTLHFMAAKTIIPLIEKNGAYTMIAGYSAVEYVPMAGPITIFGAAQLMMGTVLSKELWEMDIDVRVNSVILGFVLTRKHRDNLNPVMADLDLYTGEEVGDFTQAILNSKANEQTFNVPYKKDIGEATEKLS